MLVQITLLNNVPLLNTAPLTSDQDFAVQKRVCFLVPPRSNAPTMHLNNVGAGWENYILAWNMCQVDSRLAPCVRYKALYVVFASRFAF